VSVESPPLPTERVELPALPSPTRGEGTNTGAELFDAVGLIVEPHEVVPGQTESADRWL